MLRQQERHLPVTALPARGPRLAGAGKAVDAGQPTLALQVGSALDPGIERQRDPNEDTISVTGGVIGSAPSKPFALFVVADGMGGQARGQEASRLAAQLLAEYVSSTPRSQLGTPESLLKEGVQFANRTLHQRNQEQGTDMGTTMTAALVVDGTAYVAHVGDSRLYLYRAGGLSQITQDHSLVAALAAAGIIRPEDIYTHPRRNLIYRHLGEKASVEVDACALTLAAGDVLLLCSDGLWEMVRDPQIAAILASPAPDPAQTAHALIQAALAGGGDDNISAIVVKASRL
jgi:serine/threonine protein phosphatase PrpC